MTEEIKALQERYDFLFDAYVQGLCDAKELELAGERLRAALARVGGAA